MDIEKLMADLRNLKRPTELFGRTDYLPVINADNLHDVEMVIRQHLLDEHDKEMGMLKAKVYAYECIIANSNFAPMIITESDTEKRKPCINYEDGCEEWAGCPCVHYKAESEDK
jgi:hypothetical protein